MLQPHVYPPFITITDSSFLLLASRVGQFPTFKTVSMLLSWPNLATLKSCRTQSSEVFPLLPSTSATKSSLQADTQSSYLQHSRCPSHLKRPCLTTSAISHRSLLDILILWLTIKHHLFCPFQTLYILILHQICFTFTYQVCFTFTCQGSLLNITTI